MSDIKLRYDNIDFAKKIFAIAIVAVHIFTFVSFDSVLLHLFINGIARLAVPFFFCCTGFFLFQKGIESRETLVAFTKKTLSAYAYLSAVYFPFVIGELTYKDNLNIAGLLDYLHIAIMEGTYFHLWYFPATLLAVWLLHFVVTHKVKLKHLISLCGLLYLFGLLGDGYYGIIKYLPPFFTSLMTAYEAIFITTRNGLFFGFPFVLMGYFIGKHKQQGQCRPPMKLFFLSCAVLLIESYILLYFDLAKDYNQMISLVPVLYLGFTILLSDSIKVLKIPGFGSGFSMFVYYYHILAYGIVLACNTVFHPSFFANPTVQFILVTLILIGTFNITKKYIHPQE